MHSLLQNNVQPLPFEMKYLESEEVTDGVLVDVLLQQTASAIFNVTKHTPNGAIYRDGVTGRAADYTYAFSPVNSHISCITKCKQLNFYRC